MSGQVISVTLFSSQKLLVTCQIEDEFFFYVFTMHTQFIQVARACGLDEGEISFPN